METDGNRENNGSTARSAALQLDGEVVTDRRKQTISILESLSPLINSMRLFGLYFTRTAITTKPRAGVAIGESRRGQGVERREGWNFARIYATVLLVVASLNAVRQLLMFDGNEAIGAALFIELRSKRPNSRHKIGHFRRDVLDWSCRDKEEMSLESSNPHSSDQCVATTG